MAPSLLDREATTHLLGIGIGLKDREWLGKTDRQKEVTSRLKGALMNRFLVPSLLAFISLSACHTSDHALSHSHGGTPLTVVPSQEKAIAQKKALEGPTQTHGIASIKALVGLHLGDEFVGLKGQQMRARELVLQPGAVVAVHQHEHRPGFAYILEGEVVEFRNDHEGPITRRAGDVAIERTGVSHWWENRSGNTVRALVVDIVPTSR